MTCIQWLIIRSPLPTPRVTPVESKVPRSTRATRPSNPASDAPAKRDSSMAPPSQTPMGTNDFATTVTTPNLSQTIPLMPSMPISSTDSFPQTPYAMQMPNMNSVPPQMTPMMMSQMTQYMMMMMNSSNYSYNAQAQATDFNSALVDALRIHNVQWPSSQPPQESPLQSSMYRYQTVGRLSPDQSHSHPLNSFPGSHSQSTLIEAPVRKKRRASNASSNSLTVQDSVESKTESKSISPPSKRYKASPSTTQSSADNKLFHSKSGKELSFFVQVEMHNRSGVVTAIKVKYIHKILHTHH